MLDGLKKILNETSNSNREIFLEVNPFLLSSRMALQLIAGLHNPPSTDSSSLSDFKKLDKEIYSEDFEEICKPFFDCKSIHSFRSEYEAMKTDVLSSKDEDWTKIVLGGEFSAGKSSFLNSLLCEKEE